MIIVHRVPYHHSVYIISDTFSCPAVWTGGYTPNPGDPYSFVWLYSDDVDGKKEEFVYESWPVGEPANQGGHQHAIQLYSVLGLKYQFHDSNMEYLDETHCYICEC